MLAYVESGCSSSSRCAAADRPVVGPSSSSSLSPPDVLRPGDDAPPFIRLTSSLLEAETVFARPRFAPPELGADRSGGGRGLKPGSAEMDMPLARWLGDGEEFVGTDAMVFWRVGSRGGGTPVPIGSDCTVRESPRGRWGSAGFKSPVGTTVGALGLLPGKGGLAVMPGVSVIDVASSVAALVGGGRLLGSGGESIAPTGNVAFRTGNGGFAGVCGVACSTRTAGCGLPGRGGGGRREEGVMCTG